MPRFIRAERTFTDATTGVPRVSPILVNLAHVRLFEPIQGGAIAKTRIWWAQGAQPPTDLTNRFDSISTEVLLATAREEHTCEDRD